MHASRSTYDYIVIGGGSAGCVLASRLSEDPDSRVLLLESGRDIRDVLLRVPALASINLHRRDRIWPYVTTPQRGLSERSLATPRGRLLGGTSAINGMVYLRGHAGDYDRWAREGADGWDYASVLPFFRKSERFLGPMSPFRGGEGPMPVTPRRRLEPLSEAFIAACLEAGIRQTHDANGADQEGVAPSDLTTLRGRRMSSAYAYLTDEVRRRSNLTIRTRCLVTGIRLDRMSARTVDFVSSGTLTSATCAREIILAAGAINSPQLLMLSGIGPSEWLTKVGIKTLVEAPQVGRNLQDHLAVDISFLSTSLPSLNARLMNPVYAIPAALAWILGSDSRLGTNGFEVGAMLKSSQGLSQPDIQCMFIPVAKNLLKPRWNAMGFTLSIGPGKIESRGTVRIESADPRRPPAIDPNYLAEDIDLARACEAVEIGFSISDQPALRRTRGRLLTPSERPTSRTSREAIVRSKAFGCYHLSGSCRMGSEETGVVDPQGRIYGVDGLRVCDASIMPSIPNANLNASIIMMAEKIAADICRV
jgi:choline dehydrogenase